MASGGAEATRQRAVELLNEAKISDSKEKARLLEQVLELVARKEPGLSGAFVSEVCELQVDSAQAVRRLVAGGAEELGAAVSSLHHLEVVRVAPAPLIRRPSLQLAEFPSSIALLPLLLSFAVPSFAALLVSHAAPPSMLRPSRMDLSCLPLPLGLPCFLPPM